MLINANTDEKMNQIWLISAGLLIVASTQLASSTAPGSCASIGHSTSCCPPSKGMNCQATDGYCFCSPDCYINEDCCRDVHCLSHPRNCSDIGITQCCDDPNGTGHCDVHFRDQENNRCSCNASCHDRNDCCQDAQIFCMPVTCYGAGKYPNCCKSNRADITASACHVPGGNCYCDPLCEYFGDCCSDAPRNCSSDDSIQHNKLQSFRSNRVISRRRFYNRQRRIHQQRAKANYVYQDYPADRAQWVFSDVNQRGYRSRRRVASQPST